jgi:hypothetical protein
VGHVHRLLHGGEVATVAAGSAGFGRSRPPVCPLQTMVNSPGGRCPRG